MTFRVGTAVALLGLLLASAAAVPGNAQTPVRGGTLLVGSNQDMKTLDPIRSNDLSEREVIYLMYNTLLALAPDFSVRPEIATSWTYEGDGLRLVLKLRSGVKFHDGTPLDAEAVKWNLDWRMDMAGKSPQRQPLVDVINAVTVVDPQTVAIDLKIQAPGLLGSFGQREGFIASPTAAKKFGDDFGSNPVGSGPFVFKEWIRGNQVVLERNPSYWEAGKPYLDKIVLQNISGSVVGLQRLRTGEIDIIANLTVQDAMLLQNQPEIKLLQAPPNRWYPLQWQVDKPPFNNLKLRQAIAHAINRKQLIEIVMLGKAPIADSPTPAGLWWHAPEVKSYDYDPDKARALLKEAGYPNGIQIDLTMDELNPGAQIAQVVQDQLKASGITVNLKPVSSGTAYQMVFRRETNFTPTSWTQRPDPDGLLRFLFYTKAAANTTGYSNAEVDSLLDKARALTDQAARKPLYARAQKIITEELPYIPLFFGIQYMARRDAVQGFEWIPDQIPRFRDLWKTAAR